ncbi:hypothetical protein BJV77DRAFT_1154148 [Russula vinacea]|nr:hypothetical protein BJV77DRAFT_1154148 [Russula vinacea]
MAILHYLSALSYRRIRGIHSGHHFAHHKQITNVFIVRPLDSYQKVYQITWFIANTLSDVLIASAMIYYLRRIWAESGFLKNHFLVNIVRLTVETNLATASVSIVSLILITAYPAKSIICARMCLYSFIPILVMR